MVFRNSVSVWRRNNVFFALLLLALSHLPNYLSGSDFQWRYLYLLTQASRLSLPRPKNYLLVLFPLTSFVVGDTCSRTEAYTMRSQRCCSWSYSCSLSSGFAVLSSGIVNRRAPKAITAIDSIQLEVEKEPTVTASLPRVVIFMIDNKTQPT